MTNIRVFYLKFFQFLEVKFSIYLNMRVFVMFVSKGNLFDDYSYVAFDLSLFVPHLSFCGASCWLSFVIMTLLRYFQIVLLLLAI